MTISHKHKIWMPHWPQPLWFEPEGDSLSRSRELLQRLGNPQNLLPPVIHVAGSNGKGSTIAFLRAILEAAGYSVHSYTSPHMERFNEQINICGNMIGEHELYEYLERCRLAAGDDLAVKFFEGTTAAAFLAFSEYPADILLLETGMGGRIDPTNVVEHPLLTVITTISMDHTDFLGDNLRSIAGHKAGILKPAVPSVVSFQPQEALEVLQERAAITGSPLHIYGHHWAVQRDDDGMIYRDGNGEIPLPSPALRGFHQMVNAGNAVATVTLLDDFTIAGEHIESGLRNVRWAGRLERITGGCIASLLDNGWELWFDGGHNIAAGFALAEMARNDWHDKPLYIICGTTEGKDIAAMLRPLAAFADKLYGVAVQAEPRCMTGKDIAATAQAAGFNAPCSAASVYAAVADLLSSGCEPGRILVFGSLFFRIELVA